VDYWIGLGSNVGDGRQQIASALKRLGALPGSKVLRRSSCYSSPPWGFTPQQDFTNAVALLHSDLGPMELLQCLQGIEAELGREPGGRRWGPRTIDLDLLLAGELIVQLPGLKLPHPRMHHRAFVLVPLAELAPDLLIPARGRVARLLERQLPHSLLRLAED
jgi:2-amino-4-hydroxy-6-hydroxymethyldihydropteridine diphosphokinase